MNTAIYNTYTHVFKIGIEKTFGTLKSPTSQLCLVVELPTSFDWVTRLPPKKNECRVWLFWHGMSSRYYMTSLVQPISARMPNFAKIRAL